MKWMPRARPLAGRLRPTERLEGGLDGAGIAAIAASGDSTPTIGPFPGPLRQSQAESQVA